MTALTPTRFAPAASVDVTSGMSSADADQELHRPRPVSPKLRDPKAWMEHREAAARKMTEEPKPAPRQRQEDTPARRKISMAQYLRELDTVRQKHNQREVKNSVLDVSSREVEGIMQLSAKLRGRYLAKLLDQATTGGQPVSEASIRELARWREMYEEVEKGIEVLREAMEDGDVAVQGVIGR